MTSPRTARWSFLAASGVAAILWVEISRASWSTRPGDGLNLFFTRAQADLAGLAGGTAIFTATRRDVTAPFDESVRLVGPDGFVEVPTLSPNEKALHCHGKEGDRFIIDRVPRP